jgi:hypothetical protein
MRDKLRCLNLITRWKIETGEIEQVHRLTSYRTKNKRPLCIPEFIHVETFTQIPPLLSRRHCILLITPANQQLFLPGLHNPTALTYNQARFMENVLYSLDRNLISLILKLALVSLGLVKTQRILIKSNMRGLA